MQTTNDDETAGTNETNNGSTEDVSRLDGGPIQNENVSLEQPFAANMIYSLLFVYDNME